MPKHSRTKLVPPDTRPENQALETFEKTRTMEKTEEPVLVELDLELECPRCREMMELQSSFDILVYCCENCSFLLKCI
jgi:hypothetical protein